MEKINIIRSSFVKLPHQNIDTDQIIPARFLKTTNKEGFGKHLFSDWRYDKAGNEMSGFALNSNIFGKKILVAGKNFGCGSSREHAAWALYDFGFRVVVSSFFADIFKNNCLNNGILAVQVSDSFLHQLLLTDSDEELTIDLINQEINLPAKNQKENFKISSYKKNCLINGLNDMGFLLTLKETIISYEEKSRYLELFKHDNKN